TRAVVAAKEAVQRWFSPVLALDLVHVARSAASDSIVDFGGLAIANASTPVIDLSEEPLLANLTLESVEVGELVAPTIGMTNVVMRDCLFDRVFGYRSAENFPHWMEGCT